MNPLLFWFKQHRISTHSIAGLVLASFTAYKEVPQFHDFVLSLGAAYPKVASLAGVFAALYGWYRNGTKQ